jgi:hypothetical protein
MTISNTIKYFFYTIAVLYSIYLIYGIIIIALILFNDKTISTNTPTNTLENKSNIYIETTQKQLLNGKITIISLIIIAFLIIMSFSYYISDFIFMCIKILFMILK